jgi:glyoxylase-like metal-dependent hydrolase (beta-lactamase superfamily II)
VALLLLLLLLLLVVVVAGDTLFALGCGRLFEGHPEMMWCSLSKLLPLPRDTLVYCAHEYTQSNARFAVTVDPNNEALQRRKVAIDEAREKVGAWLEQEAVVHRGCCA